MIWSSLFSSLLLRTTTGVWKLKQIQSGRFQNIQLKKIPTTKQNRLEKKWTQNCLPKQTRLLTANLVLSSYQAFNFADFFYWMVWKLEFIYQALLINCVRKTENNPIICLFYLTLLVYLIVWYWIKKAQPKRKESESLS